MGLEGGFECVEGVRAAEVGWEGLSEYGGSSRRRSVTKLTSPNATKLALPGAAHGQEIISTGHTSILAWCILAY